jgi:hypothetical protein
MVNNLPIQEIKITPTVSVKYEVKTPLVFPPDYTVYNLELLKEMLPTGYKIVKDNDE